MIINKVHRPKLINQTRPLDIKVRKEFLEEMIGKETREINTSTNMSNNPLNNRKKINKLSIFLKIRKDIQSLSIISKLS